MKHIAKIIIAAICAVMISAAPVIAQEQPICESNFFAVAGQCVHGDDIRVIEGLMVGEEEKLVRLDDMNMPTNECGIFRRVSGEPGSNQGITFNVAPCSSPSSGGGGGGSSTGAIVGIGVAVGVGVFVLSEMAEKHGLLPRGFTPDVRFAMNDAKRPAVYIGGVYPLADNHTLRFGVSEVLKDQGDDFVVAAEWRLQL